MMIKLINTCKTVISVHGYRKSSMCQYLVAVILLLYCYFYFWCYSTARNSCSHSTFTFHLKYYLSMLLFPNIFYISEYFHIPPEEQMVKRRNQECFPLVIFPHFHFFFFLSSSLFLKPLQSFWQTTY